MSELPDGWMQTQLGSLIQLVYGKSLPDKARDGKGYPVYGSNGVVGKHSVALTKGKTIIVGRKGSVGEVNFSEVPCYPIDTTYYVDEFHGMPPKIIFYLLKTLRLPSLNKSTAIPGLNREDAYNQEINVAPLAEQKRIADKLDTLLARVDATRERLDRIPQILKQFRQSVLAAATSGKLTEVWRDQHGVSDDWETSTLVKVGEYGRGKSKHRPRNDARLFGGPYPFIQTGDVANSGGVISRHGQTLSEFGLAQSKLWPAGTLCITIAANIADTAILSYPACFPDSVVGFVPNSSKCVVQFIKWSIDVLKNDLDSSASATAQKNINLGVLSEVEFLIPSLPEQKEIVRRVDALFALADKLEARQQQARAQVEKLTPALLAKAFRGELVEQDRNDEPAEKLLERVRAAKAVAPVSKSKAKKMIVAEARPKKRGRKSKVA